jgi:hypothetical protein
MTRQEILRRFPNASADFVRANADWEQGEMDVLIDYYQNTPAEDFDLKGLAGSLNRTYNAVALKASELKLTKRGRPVTQSTRMAISKAHEGRWDSQARAEQSQIAKEWHSKHDHPKGFSGHNHSDEARRKMGEKASAWQASFTLEQRRQMARERQEKTRENGKSLAPQVQRGRWKSGWVEIGGKRFFSRSRWEVLYAGWLEWNKKMGAIVEWEYEPETFWFPVKRGSTNYTPDFKVTFTNGQVQFHEVKGWMDARSRTKLRRMAVHHKDVAVIVIDAVWFKNNRKWLNRSN